MAESETKAVLLLPKDKPKSGVGQCHGQAVTRLAGAMALRALLHSDSARWKSGLKCHSYGLELQNLVMPKTKAVFLLPKDKCENDVWQCHGQTVTRFVCHVCLNHIATHLSCEPD